tara:strand:- start:9756 stop:10178 length:423 start_codon:yes stop_codon:yes gene_type:complete
MINLNQCQLIGTITQDLVLNKTEGGSSVTSFPLAVNRAYTKTSTGEKIEETLYIDVVVWGRQAEVVVEFLGKGRQVSINGRLELTQWTDKETGLKREKIRVTSENMSFVDSRPTGDSRDGARSPDPGDNYRQKARDLQQG